MVDVDPVPTRLSIDAAQVRELIDTQFPKWAALPIQPVANGGWDNWTFHLGTELSVRLPSASAYALAVEKEHRWLPVLAPQLPVAIPVPLAKGAPDAAYPHPWSVYRWLPGTPVSHADVPDLTAIAAALADFLVALQLVDPSDGPGPGTHNWYRGGSLATWDADTQRALAALEGHIDTAAAGEIWRRAVGSCWDRPPVWFHGDVAPGNLLVMDGALVGVIDFGTCGVGDPACDLAIAWALFSGESRQVFVDRMSHASSIDPSVWARGRGWALWKALVGYAGALSDDDPSVADAKDLLDRVMADGA